MRTLLERNLVSQQDFEQLEQLEQRYNDVKVRAQINKERLDLLESGRVSIGDTVIESVIRAPISGYILEKRVEKEVELGLSDAITVAVTDGIEEGEKVFEKPVRQLTVR
ncbi:MAG: hypothetical protein JJU13_19020 [Balneolaceae bacterium]|nr:hypothetical protein [Balneolaceae bacterium]